MTLYDVFDAWYDSANESEAREIGTHAERVADIKAYADGCFDGHVWEHTITKKQAEIIIDCFEKIESYGGNEYGHNFDVNVKIPLSEIEL